MPNILSKFKAMEAKRSLYQFLELSTHFDFRKCVSTDSEYRLNPHHVQCVQEQSKHWT